MSQKKKEYTRLSISHREFIEHAIADQMSFRTMAKELGVSLSSISREVKKHSFVCDELKGAVPLGRKERGDTSGPGCSLLQNKRQKFCNGCPRLRSSICKRERHLYIARIADKEAIHMRSEARKGIDLDSSFAPHVFALIQDALNQNLSPAYIANCIEGVDVSASTIYRWIDQGEGDLCNLDLQRKVKYKKRKRKEVRETKVFHAKERLYEVFLEVSDEQKSARWEMDTVVGRRGLDEKVLLTLLHKPTHFQLVILLPEKTDQAVVEALAKLQGVLGKKCVSELFETVLTDNGSEFAAEATIAELFGEQSGKTRLFYCEPKGSNQKGSCEKNHVEIRKIIPKKITHFDELTEDDTRLIMSHVNSYKRASLGWKDPIDHFLFFFGDKAQKVLDAFSIEHVEHPNLTPNLVNESHARKGLKPVVNR